MQILSLDSILVILDHLQQGYIPHPESHQVLYLRHVKGQDNVTENQKELTIET